MSVLRALNLAKSYKSRTILKDISLEVESGEVVGLLGPNGAGKTTAFYMIVGLVPCDEGTITIGDIDVTLLPMHRRAQLGLGYLPQEASVFRNMSVQDNVMAILETRADMERAAREQRLEQLLEALEHEVVLLEGIDPILGAHHAQQIKLEAPRLRALDAVDRFAFRGQNSGAVDPQARGGAAHLDGRGREGQAVDGVPRANQHRNRHVTAAALGSQQRGHRRAVKSVSAHAVCLRRASPQASTSRTPASSTACGPVGLAPQTVSARPVSHPGSDSSA